MSNSTTNEKLERCFGTIKKDKVRICICHILSYVLAFANFLLYLFYIISPKIIGISDDKQLIKGIKELKHIVFDNSFISNLYLLKDFISPGKDIISQIIIPTIFFIINFFVALFILYAVLWLLFKPIKIKKKIKGDYYGISDDYGKKFEFDPDDIDDILFLDIYRVALIVGILIPILYFVGLGFVWYIYAQKDFFTVFLYALFLLIPLAIAMGIISWVIIYVVSIISTIYDTLFFIDTRSCQKYLKGSDIYKKYREEAEKREELRKRFEERERRNSEATQSSGCTYGVSVDPAFTAALKSSFGNSSGSQGSSSSSYGGDAYGMGDPNYNPVSGNGM